MSVMGLCMMCSRCCVGGYCCLVSSCACLSHSQGKCGWCSSGQGVMKFELPVCAACFAKVSASSFQGWL